MSTKRWLLVFALLALVLAGLSLWVLLPRSADCAEVWLDGERIAVLSLSEDAELVVNCPDGGRNLVVVKDGAVAVTEADCPDGICVARGWVRGGAPVVCLPHRLVIRLTGAGETDAVAG